jgi:multiple antibiotic resistance protein
MSPESLLAFATAMFTILNPIGNTAIFAGMVADRSGPERKKITATATLAVAAILIGTIWVGEELLEFFGVSIPGLQAAGGLIIALIGVSMLHSKQSAIHSSGEEPDSAQKESIAIVPLAMPIVAGPGAIATLMVNTHRYHGFQSNLEMSLVCAGLSLIIGLCFLAVEPITRLLGNAGINIVTKFMGLILLSVAMAMLAEGVKGMLPGLAG